MTTKDKIIEKLNNYRARVDDNKIVIPMIESIWFDEIADEILALLYSEQVKEKDDPYWYWPQCDIKYCKGVSCSGGVYWKETGHWSICPEHADVARKGEPQPPMRKSAIIREASRDENGYLPFKINK